MRARNLLSDDLSLQQLEEILSRHPKRPLLPSLGENEWRRAANDRNVQSLIAPLREMALAECDVPMPVLTDELYAHFKQTGIRLNFEREYFERRRRLGRAAISLLLCDKQDPRYDALLASVTAKLTDIFEEVSWALPAHVHWHDADVSGKEPMQIDLFCAETANLMAECLDLFGGVLPLALRQRIRDRLHKMVFENYLATPFHWKTVTHNWNAVCHQGVVGAALSQVEDASLLASMLLEARKNLPYFLQGFTADGGCTEGVGYWSYGFGWFTRLNEQLETRTGGELSLFANNELVKKIARFGPRMALSGNKLVNFSDNGAEGGISPSLLAYFAKVLEEPRYADLAAENYRTLLAQGMDKGAERCDVFLLGRLVLCLPADLDRTLTAKSEEDCYLDKLGVLVARGTDANGHRWDFAAKAGNNDEHHNHNDCGNFLLNIDGRRVVMEIGAPEYVHDYFGPKRYEFLAARSLGHSLPVINGCEQSAGAEFTSRVTRCEFTDDGACFGVDATAAYPPAAKCELFKRSYRLFKREGRLEIRDEFVLQEAGQLEAALVLSQPARLQDPHCAVVDLDGFRVRISSLAGTVFDRMETHPYRERGGRDAVIYRLVMKPEFLAEEVSLGVVLSLEDGALSTKARTGK
ncbi:MAG: heparinase II/III-family protein [Verrucomicrobiales bacterium]|jgi:hypothetical protein|nr:heparinase II/III-family protein [Verrucomicrobiales bacterium]